MGHIYEKRGKSFLYNLEDFRTCWGHKQITLPDSRYYRRHGEYYPSVTYVLQSYPKGKHYDEWLKKVGFSANWIVKKAGEEAS